MEKKEKITMKQVWDMIDHKVFIPGIIALLAIVAVGAFLPNQFEAVLTTSVNWLMDNMKWFYTLVVVLVCAVFAVICFTKLGDIRLGGKNAKPSISTATWFTLSMTGTIAVGI